MARVTHFVRVTLGPRAVSLSPMDARNVFHVLIIDADEAVRARLRRRLSASGVNCEIEEAADGSEAAERIQRGRFDLVLMDVSSAEIDRLLHTGVQSKLRSQRAALTGTQIAALEELLKTTPGHGYVSCLAVRRKGRTLFVPTSDVDWIEADDMRVRLHTGTGPYELSERLSDLERLLSPREFVRVQRGAIVRIDRIREIQPWFRGDHVIILKNGAKIRTGQSYRSAVRALLGHR